MLNESSTILTERRAAEGQSTFTALTRSQIAEWACQKPGMRATASRAA